MASATQVRVSVYGGGCRGEKLHGGASVGPRPRYCTPPVFSADSPHCFPKRKRGKMKEGRGAHMGTSGSSKEDIKKKRNREKSLWVGGEGVGRGRIYTTTEVLRTSLPQPIHASRLRYLQRRVGETGEPGRGEEEGNGKEENKNNKEGRLSRERGHPRTKRNERKDINGKRENRGEV